MQDTSMAIQLATIILKRNKLMSKYQLSGNWDKYFVYIMDTESRLQGLVYFPDTFTHSRSCDLWTLQ